MITEFSELEKVADYFVWSATRSSLKFASTTSPMALRFQCTFAKAHGGHNSAGAPRGPSLEPAANSHMQDRAVTTRPAAVPSSEHLIRRGRPEFDRRQRPGSSRALISAGTPGSQYSPHFSAPSPSPKRHTPCREMRASLMWLCVHPGDAESAPH